MQRATEALHQVADGNPALTSAVTALDTLTQSLRQTFVLPPALQQSIMQLASSAQALASDVRDAINGVGLQGGMQWWEDVTQGGGMQGVWEQLLKTAYTLQEQGGVGCQGGCHDVHSLMLMTMAVTRTQPHRYWWI